MSEPESTNPAAQGPQSAMPDFSTQAMGPQPVPAGAAPAMAEGAPGGGQEREKKKKKKKTIAGPRRVRLSLTRIDPWSVMKVSFLLSVAVGIMMVVAASVVWFMLDSMKVFSTIQELAITVMDSDSNAYTALLEYMKFSRAFSIAIVIAVVNLILTTALATIGAFLYNVTATLVGGVHLTLADE
ncbi:DUF3566 domain-containing protein [Actinomyces oricola]